jgi:hypothetical protein
MPFVRPVIAVNAHIAQEPDDLLLHHLLAREGGAALQDVQHVGVRGHRGVALEGKREEVVDPFEGSERAGRYRIAVAVEHAERERGVVRIGAEPHRRDPHSVLGQGAGQPEQVGLSLPRMVAGQR